MTDGQPPLRFHIGINPLWPGEKVLQADRQYRYHGAFKSETHTPESLLAEIKRGHAFCPELQTGDCGLAHHGRWCSGDKARRSYCPDAGKPGHCGRPDGYRNSHHFRSAQHLALDIDSGNPSVDDLLADPFIFGHATFIYPTISWKLDNRKWRVLFVLDEAITDAQVYRRASTALLDRYETTDQQVKDPARLFFGTTPNNGEPVFLGNLLPMVEVRKLVSAYEELRRNLEQRARRRDMPPIDPASVTGDTPDEKYVAKAILEELAYLSSRTPGSGERYPSIIPAAMSLESLRLSDWLSVEARAQINVEQVVLDGCARNGALDHYGEAHLRRAINWGIAHAEPRPTPPDWTQRRRLSPPRQRRSQRRPNFSVSVEI